MRKSHFQEIINTLKMNKLDWIGADTGTSVLQWVVGKIEGGETWAGVMGQGSSQFLSEITAERRLQSLHKTSHRHACVRVSWWKTSLEICRLSKPTLIFLRVLMTLKVWDPHVLSPALSRTNSSSRPERDTTRRICSHTSADWGDTGTPGTLAKETQLFKCGI